MPKNVLIISHSFPPHGGIAAQRPAALFRFLPEFGWTPHIITNRWTARSTNAFDHDFHKSNIYRQSVIECNGNPSEYSLMKAVDWISDKLLPSNTPRRWFRAALKEADRFCKSSPPNAIWATYGPQGALKIASLMQKRYGIPWIADFRDTARLLAKNLAGWYNASETRTCRNASAITTVSAELADELRLRHERPVEVVYNGFFPEDVASSENDKQRNETFVLVYTGTIDSRKQDATILFDALDQLLVNGHINPLDFAVRFAGTSQAALGPYRSRPSACLISIHDWLPKAAVRQLRADAGALILLTCPTQPGVLTGKVFEYLTANRPILAVPNDNGCIYKLLKQTNTGESFSTPCELAERINKLYLSWKHNQQHPFSPNWESIYQFSRRGQVKKVSEILDRIAKSEDNH
jgi:hypothetical protein